MKERINKIIAALKVWWKNLIFDLKNTTKIKAKMKIIYLNHILPHWRVWLVCVGITLILCCVIARIAAPYKGKYEYVDTMGNHGVATTCYIADFGLVCEEYYGQNTIQVVQYSKID